MCQLMFVHPRERSIHVIEVDSDVRESGLDVVMAVHGGDRLDGDAAVVEVPAEGPPQGMVREIEAESLPDLMDDGTVKAVPSLRVPASGGFVTVMAPDQERAWIHPVGIVRTDGSDHLPAVLQPGLEDLLAEGMEREAPPLADAVSLSEDGDETLGRVLVEVDILQHEIAYLRDAEAHAQLEMDHGVLERREPRIEDEVAFLLGQPVDVGTLVVAELDLHVLDDLVLEVLQITVEDVQVPVLGGYGEVVPEP